MNYPAPFTNSQSLTGQVSDVREPEVPFKYTDENAIFQTMVTGYNDEITRCTRRRELRKNRISVKELRDKDQILNDETVIPARTIDTNIRREKAPYVKFIEQATAVLAFTDPNVPNQNYSALQAWHTDLIRVGDWKMPHFLNIDAILLHGGGYLEVVFDATKPSMSSVEYVRRDCLIIPPGTEDLQACTRIYRKFRITKQQFKELSTKYAFDAAQAAKLGEHVKNDDKFLEIYKAFMKDKNGIVFLAWRGPEGSTCDDWLVAPRPLDLGIYEIVQTQTPNGVTTKPQPTPIKEYPIIFFPYHVEEDEVILDVQGRAALDLHVQDALTSLWSGTVNGTTRASRFYPTRKAAAGETPKNKELFELKHGHVFEGDFSIFQPAYPNNIAVSVAQALAVNKSQEMGSVDYAAMNRQDTAKTATELNLAQQEADSLGGVNISLYSRCNLKVESLRWRIIISQIRTDMMMGVLPEKWRIKPPAMDTNVLLSPSLVLTMAADAQVVRRAQRMSKFQQNWPLVANTPFALPYLKSMLSDMFPDEYPLWLQAVGEADQGKQMLGTALDMMSKMSMQNVPQPMAQQMVEFMNAAHQFLKPAQK